MGIEGRAVPIKRNGKVLHRATIRNDWQKRTWESLAKTFPDAYIITDKKTMSLWSLAENPPKWEDVKEWNFIEERFTVEIMTYAYFQENDNMQEERKPVWGIYDNLNKIFISQGDTAHGFFPLEEQKQITQELNEQPPEKLHQRIKGLIGEDLSKDYKNLR